MNDKDWDQIYGDFFALEALNNFNLMTHYISNIRLFLQKFSSSERYKHYDKINYNILIEILENLIDRNILSVRQNIEIYNKSL